MIGRYLCPLSLRLPLYANDCVSRRVNDGCRTTTDGMAFWPTVGGKWQIL
jgi:hypothetical protein